MIRAQPRPVSLLASACRPVAGRLALATVAGVAASGSAIGLMATSAWLISRAATHPPVLHLMTAIVGVRAFGLSRGVFRYGERLVGHDAALRVLANLRVRTYQAMARLTPAGLAGRRRGDLVTRFVSDVDTLLDLLIRTLLPYLVALWVAVCSVVLMAVLCPPASVALAIGLLIVAVAVPAGASFAGRIADGRIAPLRGDLASQTIDLVHGLADATAYGAVHTLLGDLSALDDKLRVASARSSAITGIGTALTTLTSGLCALVGLAAGTVAVRSGEMNGEVLAVVTLTPLAVFEAVGGLPLAATHLRAAWTALNRVASVVAAPDPTPDPRHPSELPGPVAPSGHQVRATEVHASWDTRRPVLRGVNLCLHPGRSVALVGRSGAGKSTIAAVLVRFLRPSAGRVSLNEANLDDLAADEVRQVIGLCDDEAYLFDSTIEANLRIGAPDASADRLREALAAVRLLDWVDELPRGLATRVGEHGVRVSGGQRRRLALARALLNPAEILVLDEPAEHLDEPTAEGIVTDLLRAAAGRTIVIITHRTAHLDAFDEVITVVNGTVRSEPKPVRDGCH